MKKIVLTIVILTGIISLANAQETATKESPKKFMQVTTIESVIGGGFGRSKMIITKEDGSQEGGHLPAQDPER